MAKKGTTAPKGRPTRARRRGVARDPIFTPALQWAAVVVVAVVLFWIIVQMIAG